ncbi:MAG: outer membrane lipid asymmetry maintenance protein MlaD [Nevskiales bacterium]
MSNNRILELIVGAFVILGVLAVFFLTMRVSDLGSQADTHGGFAVQARFENIGGLKVGAPVSMAGVRVGRVTGIQIDPQSFEALVTIELGSRYNYIPDDSDASILTAGLLGEQYVGLTPGGSERPLQAGDTIKFTQSALILEKIIGQFLFSKAEEGLSAEPAQAATGKSSEP